MMIKSVTKYVAVLVLFVFTGFLKSDDAGEMLRFLSKVQVDTTISVASLQAGDSVAYLSAMSAPTTSAFNQVFLNGKYSDRNVTAQLRYLLETGQMSDWYSGASNIHPNGRFWARFDLPEQPPTRIQFRILNRGVEQALQLQVFAVQAVNSKVEESDEAEAEGANVEKGFFSVDTIRKPYVVSREEWGAMPPVGNYIPHSPYRMAQHHTAGQRISTLEDGIDEMQFIQDFHQNGRGWQDIGYHFCVDDAGRFYEGVPPDFRGTHAGGNNTGNVGISYFGNFDESGQHPTQTTLDSLVQIWSWLGFEYTINPDSLLGHRDYTATACPGDNFYPDLPILRNGIRHLLGFGAPYAANPYPQPFLTEVSPNTVVFVAVRDEEEGVDLSTLEMTVNGELVTPQVSGNSSEYQLLYEPAEPFPQSQNVIVNIQADDFADPANSMNYSYQFQIEVAALHAEVIDDDEMLNADLEIEGDWTSDFNDVNLDDLTSGARLYTVDDDASHHARIYPHVSEPGDYRVLIASNSTFLGESARYNFVNENGAVHPHFAEYNSVYYLGWGELSPTPIYFNNDADTSGYIEISGIGDYPTRLMIDAFRLEKVDRLDPPSQPTIKWVRKTTPGSNEVEIAWYPSLEGDIAGYRIYQSEDGLTWGDPFIDESSVDAATSSYTTTYMGDAGESYFRIVAVDTNKFVNEDGDEVPFLSAPSDVYGAGFNNDRTILIVDNFDRIQSWSQSHHPFVASYGKAITARGNGFESVTETAVQNGDIDLIDFEVVIYFCGDDSRADESIAAADQHRLLAYLENGGKLFISGSELGYDFDATTSAELDRYEYLCRATYEGDLSGSNRVLGQNGTTFQGLDFEYGTQNGPDLYIEDYPDYILPEDGSEVAMFYDNLRIAGVQYTGPYGDGAPDAQMIYLGFTFETIVSPLHRRDVMAGVLTYFDIPVSLNSPEETTPREFALFQNYPNPFNPSTVITYQLPVGSKVSLKVYDVTGQLVRTLLDNQRQAASTYTIEWDGTSEDGLGASSGMYFYTLEARDLRSATSSITQTRKMLLIK